ncbi:MAG: GWxTD domain-containing protein [Fidelibacterota bacterium]|nr:MAG: GWxTD domain-containing protein [Candidatus Neomarinimicrobiota bacterium]
MIRRVLTIFFLIGVLFAPDRSNAQRLRPERGESPLELAVGRFPTSGTDSIQVNVFTMIPLDKLVFLAHNGEFKSTYELSIFVVDKDETAYGTRIWQEEVVKSQFKETQSEDLYHIAHTSFMLSSGEYRIVANLMDLDSRQIYKANKKFDVTGYPLDQLALSDILLVLKAEDLPGEPDRIIPFIGNKVSDKVDSFFVYLAIRSPIKEPRMASLHCTLGEKDDTSAVLYNKTLALGSPLSTHFIPVATSDLKDQKYILTVKVQVDSLEAEQSLPIQVTLTGFSHLIEDVDQAIEQARYVATNAKLREMRNAGGEEARREAFLAFWRALDPTPETPRNELLNEYYSRVAYANIHFRSLQPGWETDMGMVYVIYGQPDEVERHPFDIDSKPYQIWFYYSRGLRFVFVDVNMLGDYRLITPLYPTRSF